MIIEMFGLPGAGKTTLADGLRRGFPSVPLVETPTPSGFLTVRSILSLSVKLAFRCPMCLMRLTGRRDGRWLLAKLGYRMAGGRRWPTHGIVVDSGVLQPLLSYAAENACKAVDIRDVLALLDALPLPNIVLYVAVPPEVAYERYLLRQEIEGARSGVSVSLLKYLHAETVLHAILDRLASHRILKVTNISPLQDHQLLAISEQLSHWIEGGKST